MAETKLQNKHRVGEFYSLFKELGIETASLTDQQLSEKFQTLAAFLEKSSDAAKETSIDLAYKISTDYMETAISRFDKIDDKIQTLFTLSIGVFAIAPTLLKANAADKINGFFWVGIALLVLAGIISIIARIYGKLTILNPRKIYEGGGLEATPDNFKRSVVKLAAEAYDKNSVVLENKYRLNIASMAIFGIALVSLVYWLVSYAL